MSNSPPNHTQGRLRIGSPADVLAVIPYLLGFHPAESLVVLGLAGSPPRVGFTVRMELPERDADHGGEGDEEGRDYADYADYAAYAAAADELAAYVADVAAAQQVRETIVVAYGPSRRADRVIESSRAKLDDCGIGVREMLRAQDGRYWSYTCTDARCCPAGGVPYDVSSSPVAAAATVAGHVALPDRETLERSIAPLGGITRVAMRQATERAEDRIERWAAECRDTGTLRQRMADEGSERLRDALEHFRTGGGGFSDDDTAWLSILLRHLQVRDEAWLRIDEHGREAHLALWTHVVRRAEEPYVPAPACLLAFTAWQRGNGALASIAVQRAQSAEPEYSMATLMEDVLVSAIPPDSWRPPIRPEDLPALYAEG